MAYDKLVDSAQLDAGLMSVADAIRAKGGTSEELAFPDGFVSAVEGIQAGGGADTILGREYMSGSFTLAEDTTSQYEIADVTKLDTNRTYNIVGLMFREPTNRGEPTGMGCAVCQARWDADSMVSVGYAYSSPTSSTAVKNGGLIERIGTLDGNKLIACFTSNYPGFAGETYSWLALRYEKAV